MVASINFKSVIQFDRKIIKRKWSKLNKGPIARAGILLAMKARGMIRSGKTSKKSGKRLPSKPKQPPKSWAPGQPFKQIFSAPNFTQTTATVGMVGFGGITPVPELHEKGGTVKRKVWVERSVFKHKHTRKTHGRFAQKRVIRTQVTKSIRYPPRPFMSRALDKMIAQGKLPSMWQGSISKAGIT